MRNALLFALLGLLLVVAAGCGSGSGGGDDGGALPPPSGGSMSPAEEALGRDVLALVNMERGARGLGAVTWHVAMAQVAYEHSYDMDARSFFSHTNPSGEGPGDRLLRGGVVFTALGENIAYGAPTADLVMALWMGSPGHRANILNAGFERCSIGVHRSTGGTYWTMMLIRE